MLNKELLLKVLEECRYLYEKTKLLDYALQYWDICEELGKLSVYPEPLVMV